MSNTKHTQLTQNGGYAILKSGDMDYAVLMQQGETPVNAYKRWAWELRARANSMIAKSERIFKAIEESEVTK